MLYICVSLRLVVVVGVTISVVSVVEGVVCTELVVRVVDSVVVV